MQDDDDIKNLERDEAITRALSILTPIKREANALIKALAEGENTNAVDDAEAWIATNIANGRVGKHERENFVRERANEFVAALTKAVRDSQTEDGTGHERFVVLKKAATELDVNATVLVEAEDLLASGDGPRAAAIAIVSAAAGVSPRTLQSDFGTSRKNWKQLMKLVAALPKRTVQ